VAALFYPAYETPYMNRPILTLGLAALTSCVLAGTPSAKDVTKTEPEAPQTLAKQLENLGRIYHSEDENSLFQDVWFLGRYHGQYHWTDGSAGEDEGYESRRVRLGTQVTLLKKLTLHAQAISGSDFEPTYNGFTELWAQWQFNKEFGITVGQQKNRFTWDRNLSSRYINVLERSMLTNMWGVDYTPAVTISGTIGDFNYYTGVFSNFTDKDMGRAFTEFDGGWSYLFAGTWDLHDKLGTDHAWINASYLHSDFNEFSTNMNRFQDGVAAALILTEGSMGLTTEVTAGFGAEGGDVFGINFQPTFFLTDKVQLVGRYQLATSNGAEGLQAQRRYERNAGLGKGDLYQAAFLGVHYLIAAHRIKLISGVEYATIGGENTWTAYTGFRVFWGPHSNGPYPAGKNGTLPGAF
jgi:phosphate-selective porin OprO and OprP